MGLRGCKWSSLKAPGSQTPLSHSVLELDFSLFSLLALFWGIKNWPPSIKMRQMEIYLSKMGWMGCKWCSLNALGTEASSHTLEHRVFLGALGLADYRRFLPAAKLSGLREHWPPRQLCIWSIVNAKLYCQTNAKIYIWNIGAAGTRRTFLTVTWPLFGVE